MYRKLAVLGLVLACVIGAFVFLRRPAKADHGFRSGVFDPPRDAPDFELDGSTGAKVHLSDYRGKVVVLEFGFTFCQQVCPVTLANLVAVRKKLGNAARDVQMIFVTVDPKRDTPARLDEFLSAFDRSFVGATGAPPELERVRTAYGIMAEQVAVSNDEAAYDHSSFIYLIDRHGKIRVFVPFGKPPDDIAHDIELLLAAP